VSAVPGAVPARAPDARAASRPTGARGLDPRLWQIAFLALLFGTGVLARDFTIAPDQVLACFAAGLATQLAWVRALGLARVGVLSALITCFGLSILLRADSLWVHPLAACLCLSAKFALRLRGKHLFNPGMLGIVTAVLFLPGAWISPGQWGSDLAFAGWIVVLGALVASRARRIDSSLVFLAVFLGGALLRVLWLGQDWGVWGHQLQSGALLMFAFFMISDPMTSPDREAARLAHAACVAAVALALQFGFWIPNGAVWALFLCAPLVPLLDRCLPAPRFAWQAPRR